MFDEVREFSNNLMQQLLDDVILMCSTHDEGKVVVAEIFIRTLEIKIYKQMTVNDIASYLGYSNKLLVIS